MEVAFMIVREFYIQDMELRYFVGITQISLDIQQLEENKNLTNEKDIVTYLLKQIQEIQNISKASVIQIFSDKYVLCPDHIFIACYYLQKAFFHKTCISNKKNVEFLLYLSTYRQINKAIEAFGIDVHDVEKGNLLICIISTNDDINEINNQVMQVLKAHETELTIKRISSERIKRIIVNYDFLDSQINAVLKTYHNDKKEMERIDENLETLTSAILDLLCEKMALLNIEKVKPY
jgi:tRNA threonylcarbamoyladenosine modification (KEOPS) complex Cgi121 subunit